MSLWLNDVQVCGKHFYLRNRERKPRSSREIEIEWLKTFSKGFR